MTGVFQCDAFQNDAFQTDCGTTPPPVIVEQVHALEPMYVWDEYKEMIKRQYRENEEIVIL